ncbi:MAG: hypothetical protein QXX08_00745 [Candidatus Bathyarchaeia archaeon]
MRFHVSLKVSRLVFLILVMSSVLLDFHLLIDIVSAQFRDSINYLFVVDEEGRTSVKIIYRSDSESGSSWILVPKTLEWSNRTISGKVTYWSLNDTENLIGEELYFYEALCFSFNSDNLEFEMNIQFNFTTAAMIIEPNGIFYSPQIGFKEGNRLEASVIFPNGFKINQDEAVAVGTGFYQPAYTNSNYVRFDNFQLADNMIRIEIGFQTHNEKPETSTIKEGIFTFETVKRYESYARDVLNFYNKVYKALEDLFNVTFENAGDKTFKGINVQFFLPDFDSLLTVGGYVPFSGEEIGDIHINIVFTRFIEGYIEVIALHELIHHFLWEAGISPESLLWFHEGMAQYVSLKITSEFGYEGSKIMRQEIEDGVLQLTQMIGDKPDLGFLKYWNPSYQPRDMATLYVASYYVVSRLAEPRGGLKYYATFFKVINSITVEDTVMLGYYLSLAANESIVTTLNSWNFDIPDLYVHSTLIDEVARAISAVNPVFQPYKSLAELFYRQALSNAGKGGSASAMQQNLSVALMIARLASLLTLLTWSGIVFVAILLFLKRKGVFQNF